MTSLNIIRAHSLWSQTKGTLNHVEDTRTKVRLKSGKECLVIHGSPTSPDAHHTLELRYWSLMVIWRSRLFSHGSMLPSSSPGDGWHNFTIQGLQILFNHVRSISTLCDVWLAVHRNSVWIRKHQLEVTFCILYFSSHLSPSHGFEFSLSGSSQHRSVPTQLYAIAAVES